MLTTDHPRVKRYALEKGISRYEAMMILRDMESRRDGDFFQDALAVATGVLVADAVESLFDSNSSFSGGGGDFGGGGASGDW